MTSKPPIRYVSLCAIAAALALVGCGEKSADPADALPDVVSFNAHIRPLFAQNCAACHGGVKKSGELSYVFEKEAIKVGASGNPSIVRGDPAASYLIEKITSTDPEVRMPPPEHGPALSPRQIGLMKRWIEQGAVWEEHWAFTKPKNVSPPQPKSNSWIHNEIDAFILDRLEKEGLTHSGQASKGALLRRVTLDLTGVPPTEAERDAFLADTSDHAFETVVDRLLASPRYGERWASMWLDLARYADSKGLGQDTRRPTMYKYRDWVIRAFNADMPFDAFSIKQIAGDLLPEPTLDDFLATAFHRNTQSEDEGGTDDEEFRIVSQIDRVNTTWQVWHGTTMGCVQCHSHPYDPIRHDEYYRFMDFFNSTQDGDLKAENPTMKFPVDNDLQEEIGPLIAPKRALQKRIWEKTNALNQQTSWNWLDGMTSETDRPDALRYTFEKREGRQEFVFTGTPTTINQTIRAPLPETKNPIQALRFDVRPHNLKNAPYKASPGFKLAAIKVHLISEDEEKREIELDAIYRDEPFPFLPANVRGDTGYSALSYMFHDRWAVFRFKDPLQPKPGERLEISFKHGESTGMKDLLLIRRGAFGLTNDPSWRELDSDSEYKQMKQELAALKETLYEDEQVAVPIMVERPDHLTRPTKTFIRGNWNDLGEPQVAATPASFHPLPDSDEPKRLKVARWLVDKENPLAARVLVSRFWKQLFGTGIVETLEDFGSVGLRPSHPKLLDFLAHKLMDDFDWSMKDFLRYLVTSAAYQQDNRSTPELNERDPKNRLLARGPRTRLTGEMVRDQSLAIGGSLNDKMYGPPIMPQQPAGGWNPSHGGAGKWVESSEDESNRRSIYILWQRSSVYPVLSAFDAPTRELCSDRRINSNTPVQPLFTLNDPALFRASQQFAARMREHEGSLQEKIAWGYRLAICEDATPATLAKLVALHDNIIAMYPENEAKMKIAWDAAVETEYKEKRETVAAANKEKIKRAERKKLDPPTDLPDPEQIQSTPEDAYNYSAEQAAFDNLANVILNLDTALTK